MMSLEIVKQYNELLYKKLEEIASKKFESNFPTESYFKSHENNSTEKSVDYFNTKIKELDFKLSETFFTDNFGKKIMDILVDGDAFSCLSNKDKRELQDRLNILSSAEVEWKEYSKKLVRSTELDEISRFFTKQYEDFHVRFTLYSRPDEKVVKLTQRGERNYMLFKTQNSMLFFFSKLIETGKFDMLKPLLKLSRKDYKEVIEDYISSKRIFNDLVKISIKAAHDNLFNDKGLTTGYNYNENALIAKHSHLIGIYPKIFAMTLINATLNYAYEKNMIEVDVAELSAVIKQQLFYNIHNLAYSVKGDNQWGLHCDSAISVFKSFEKCGFFTKVLKEKAKRKHIGNTHVNKLLVLPKMLESEALRSLKLPYVVQPEDLDFEGVEGLVKPVLYGEGRFSRSKTLCDVLNYSRSNTFRISDPFQELITFYLTMQRSHPLCELLSVLKIDLSFPTIVDIVDQDMKLLNTFNNPKTNISHVYITNEIKTQIVGNTFVNVSSFFSTLLMLAQSTTLESIGYLIKEKEKRKTQAMKLERKYIFSTCTIAKWFKDYPLYITDILCIRLRMYPREHWVSRTSGVLKHLLCDYETHSVDKESLRCLLCAYYAPDSKLDSSFRLTFAEGSTYEKSDLFEFFHCNYLDFTKSKKNLYSQLLHIDILKVEMTNKTSINLEIDQTASGIVLLALVLRDKNLAKVANLLVKSPSCPYTFVMSKFEYYYENSLVERAETVKQFLSSNRKIHKYALMCFTYNQTHSGRMVDFAERWLADVGRFPSESEKRALNEFALKYPSFIESVFPGTTKKLEILNEVVELVARETHFFTLRTLDGVVLTWTFYKHTEKKRASYDPVSRVCSSYSISMYERDECGPIVDLQMHKRKFLSYLIHSIDAAVLRFYIKEMRERYGFNINHLHDCVILSPHKVKAFYELVDELYKSDALYNITKTMIFDQVRTSLSSESQIKLDILEKEYFSLCDNFREEMLFDPENIYRYEK